MTFDEILTQALDLLQRQRRLSYRVLKRRFDLDDTYLEDLKVEIIQVQRLARDEDSAVLAEALTHVDTTGERPCAAEVYRLKGELLLRQAIPDEAQAETCLHQALDIARHQEATSWELRVVLSLSRLWQRQGKHAEAHQLLAESYGWFTEEFDAVDLQEAQALLEELA
jgi:hypothetical protein